jgi:hypothetical protein
VYLELVFNEETRRFNLAGISLPDLEFPGVSLSADDSTRLVEAITEILKDPSDCTVARVWLDGPKGGGYIDWR